MSVAPGRGCPDRAPADVPELDVVATDYFERVPGRDSLHPRVEGWGWHEAFTMLGGMKYLAMAEGNALRHDQLRQAAQRD